MTTSTARRPTGVGRLLPVLALLCACRGGPEGPGEVPLPTDRPDLPTTPPSPEQGPLPEAVRAPEAETTPAREDEGPR